MLSAGDAKVGVTQMGSLPKNPSVQGSPRILPPLSTHAASLAILTTHISCHAHTTDQCTSYRSDTWVEDALRKSRASPPPHLRSPRTSSLHASCKVPTSSSHDDRSCSSPSAHSASSPPLSPPCLSSSLLIELLLLLAHHLPQPSTTMPTVMSIVSSTDRSLLSLLCTLYRSAGFLSSSSWSFLPQLKFYVRS